MHRRDPRSDPTKNHTATLPSSMALSSILGAGYGKRNLVGEVELSERFRTLESSPLWTLHGGRVAESEWLPIPERPQSSGKRWHMTGSEPSSTR